MRELILALSVVITVGGSAIASPQASGSAAPAAAVSTAPAATSQVRSFDMEGLVPNVLRVVVFKDDDLVALGSGVVIGRGDGGVYVATNYHVIADGSPNGIRVLAPARRTAGEDDEGRPQVVEREAEYKRSDTGRGKDIAILFVPGLDRPPVTLLEDALTPDAEIRALGYPSSDMALWRRIQPRPWITDGRVSAMERQSIVEGGSAVDQIVHTADLNSGMSGGPLVDHCGRLVGLNTAFLTGSNGTNVAIGVADVRRLARELGADLETDGGACGVEPLPAATLQNAEAPPVTASRTSPFSLPLWAVVTAGGALALLAIGAAVALLMRRKGGMDARTAVPCPSGLLWIGVGDGVRDQQRALSRSELDAGIELGRQPGFGDDSTSRRHVMVQWTGFEFVIRDVGSLNGTFVNGRDIRGLGDQPLTSADFVNLGDRSASFRIQNL